MLPTLAPIEEQGMRVQSRSCLTGLIAVCLGLAAAWPVAAQQPKLLAVLGAKDKSRFQSFAFSPDGKTLAAICRSTYPAKIKLLDPFSGKLLASFDAYRHRDTGMEAVIYSPDGKILASVGEDLDKPLAQVKFWDSGSQKLIREFDTNYYALAFSPDGSILATSGPGLGVQLWDVQTGKKLRLLATTKRMATMLAFSPDGKILASSSVKPAARVKQDTDVTLSDPTTGQETGTVSLQMTPCSLAFSPDGKTLACGGHEHYLNKIELWDLAAGKATTLLKDPKGKVGSGITGIAYTPDGKTLITASSAQIALVDAATGKTKSVLEGVGSNTFALSPDGTTVATRGNAGSIRVWAITPKKK
jgi:WD40 repeat protein